MAVAGELSELFGALFGTDIRSLGLAWARALPLVVLAPAFGLSAVAMPIRLGLSIVFALTIVPSLASRAGTDVPFAFALFREFAYGLPPAVAVALLSWTALMAGALADDLRGARETANLPLFEEPAPPIGALFGLFAAVAFLETGGAARAVTLLTAPDHGLGLARVATLLSGSIGVALSLSAPLLAGSLFVEIGSALIARAAQPAHALPLLAPLRSLALLAVVWVVFDRVAALLSLLASRTPF